MGRIKISDPVVVGCSAPNESRWGHFQFPSLFRLPAGELMVTVNDADDATSGYGHPLRRFVSSDGGRTWQDAGQAMPGTGPHASCAEIFCGEHMMLPATAAFDLEAAGLQMPAPVGKAHAYKDFLFYRVDQCPPAVRKYVTRLPAWRWTPAAPAWTAEQVRYDIEGQLCWMVADERRVPRSWFEHAPIRHNGELLYVDYRVNCLTADGSVPEGSSCLLMTSRDNGRSFQKRSVIASGRTYEPMLADTADGELVCIIRGADHEQRPMLITWSRDHGRSWEQPRPMFESRPMFAFGVFPGLVRLGNGALLLSFGRPGVWLSASLDGTGRAWTEPMPVIKRDPSIPAYAGGQVASIYHHTCGYTGLLPIGDDEALLVYSDFQHTGPDGQQCKSVEVRRITLIAQAASAGLAGAGFEPVTRRSSDRQM